MKALIINNEIKLRFNEVPKFLKEYPHIQRLDLLNKDELTARGIQIVEIEKPAYDSDIEDVVNERFDSTLNKVIFDVADLEINLETERTKKLQEFEQIVEGELMDALKVGILEKLALGEPIPQETKDKLLALRSRKASIKRMIEGVTDSKALRKFKFDRTEIETNKEKLKAARKL